MENVQIIKKNSAHFARQIYFFIFFLYEFTRFEFLFTYISIYSLRFKYQQSNCTYFLNAYGMSTHIVKSA